MTGQDYRKRDQEREEEEISLGKTTKSYRGIIVVRPEMRERKSVPVSTDGNECFFCESEPLIHSPVSLALCFW